MKYKKKPIPLEVMQFTGDNLAEVLKFIAGDQKTITIPTIEGMMTAQKGDYIIKGIRGECYPCKEDIFLETYEPAEEKQP